MKRLTYILPLLLLAGCGTGVGRAFDQAWNGTPEEVVSAVQFVDKNMSAELREKYAAVDEAPVTNPDGSVNSLAAENRFRDMAILNIRIERWDALSKELADYLGIDLDEKASLSEREADKRRKDIWKALTKSAKDAVKDLKD